MNNSRLLHYFIPTAPKSKRNLEGNFDRSTMSPSRSVDSQLQNLTGMSTPVSGQQRCVPTHLALNALMTCSIY